MEEITIEEFQRLDLRVGKIVDAKNVEGAKKLLQLVVDIGSEYRQLVAGIAEVYSPQDLIGKEVVIVANLKPAVIRGIQSNGMILAASDGGVISVISPDREMPPGAKVK
ncbi:TPA: methionine--tRNA ligase subunit beta [bacterium]|jgi:methionyl-tRNA synthetase|nr:methionine--tRNA ligase subunit beta [bacterium]